MIWCVDNFELVKQPIMPLSKALENRDVNENGTRMIVFFK